MRQIYGIDLSQEKFDVNFLNLNNESKSFVVKNNLKGITHFLENLSNEAVLCAEHTGVYGQLLMFIASCMDIPISLSSGYEIRHSLGLVKGKCDKIDAQRIREYGERFFDKLKFVKYSSEDLKELNELYTLRAQLVKERKMLLTHEEGKKYLPYNSIAAHAIAHTMIESLNKGINEIEHEINGIIISTPELRSNFELVTGIRGIGQVTACDLIIKTGNFKEIDTAKKAASFAGVCPFPNESGKMVKKSKVSQMADKKLKTLLYLCSVVAISQNPEYKLYYLRKKQEGKPYFLIMNNLANKLLRTIYSIVNSKKEYTLGHITKDPREYKKVA
ncbi:MAG: transposase [Prolixibacteraceae bacterium]|jgi:transposase|nr:transposase [Prolixibacteraceae bacterium]